MTMHNNLSNPNLKAYDACKCSKMALNAFAVMLADQLKSSGCTVASVIPGYPATSPNQYKGAKARAEG